MPTTESTPRWRVERDDLSFRYALIENDCLIAYGKSRNALQRLADRMNELDALVSAARKLADNIGDGDNGAPDWCAADHENPRADAPEVHMKKDQAKPWPKTWEHRKTKKRVAVMPWWECLDPIATEKDLLPMPGHKDQLVKIGSLVQIGWLLENEHGVWLGVGLAAAKQFKEVPK